MKKACIVTHPFYNNNRLFDMDDKISNRDECLYLFYALKKAFEKKNIDLATQDINSIEDSGIVIYNDMPDVLPDKSHIEKSYLLIFESELIKPDNWDLNKHKHFKKIFTWHDDFVDNKKYFKINFSHKLPVNFDIDGIFNSKNRFCTLISGNKMVYHPLELYSKRVEAIKWFEKHHPDDFDLYGIGWQEGFQLKMPALLKPFKRLGLLKKIYGLKFASYKGKVESKFETLKNCKFAICYENAKDIPGYITEKIFDCLFSGCVPVYWGANNITDYVPENCFIDKRKFETYEELNDFLVKISDEEYYQYLKNIKDYLNSEKITPFIAEHFAETVVKNIEEI